MRITEALKIVHAADKGSRPFQVALACGFTPLHLSTFLSAHLQKRLGNRPAPVSPGLYGDLAGTLDSLRETDADAIAVALEWPDLDPRLGFRSLGRWGASAVTDIVSQVESALHRLTKSLERLPRNVSAALSMPGLPLPPLFHPPGCQESMAETKLFAMVADFASNLQRATTVKLVNRQRLAEDSPLNLRFDLKSDLVTGLPYTLTHANALASAFAQLLVPPAPKKGLITDLDDTLWSGLVGEVGPDGVTWDLASHKALHGLYQKLLGSLAEEGVLLAVASKNDQSVVAKAFERADLLLPPASVFPMEVHWNAKSGSVARILKRWNIAADSVVFVDDSPLELGEVAAAHPGIECIQFPGKDYASAGLDMLRRLRDLFGKARMSEEDSLRLNSIRQAADFDEAGGSGNVSDDFLAQLQAVVSFDFADGAVDARALELVNKTNQFNLNGVRFTDAEWAKRLARKGSFLAVAGYEDKFGPLGKIGVLQGTQLGRLLRVEVWVLSCRAFARRIEHQCLRMLFDHFEAETIEFDFARTARNGPIADFLLDIPGVNIKENVVLSREDFDRYCPTLYHQVKEMRRVEVNG